VPPAVSRRQVPTTLEARWNAEYCCRDDLQPHQQTSLRHHLVLAHLHHRHEYLFLDAPMTKAYRVVETFALGQLQWRFVLVEANPRYFVQHSCACAHASQKVAPAQWQRIILGYQEEPEA